MEVVVIDSGSVDGTIEIAKKHDARITTIEKSEFSFGRSLNRGCSSRLETSSYLYQGTVFLLVKTGFRIFANLYWSNAQYTLTGAK